jgi:hypothetical protein
VTFLETAIVTLTNLPAYSPTGLPLKASVTARPTNCLSTAVLFGSGVTAQQAIERKDGFIIYSFKFPGPDYLKLLKRKNNERQHRTAGFILHRRWLKFQEGFSSESLLRWSDEHATCSRHVWVDDGCKCSVVSRPLYNLNFMSIDHI